MRKLLVLAVLALVVGLFAATTSDTWAGDPKPGKFNTRGEATEWLYDPGFDGFGYNYGALMFNGRYCDYDRVIGGDYCDVDLIMKWSDVWMSNIDSNSDGDLDRGYVDCRGVGTNAGLNQSHCPGAWLTNHQRGVNEDGTRWTYFVKIVYPPGGPIDADNDGFDDVTGGEIIWGSFVIIQQGSNDPAADEHGLLSLVKPAGFGAY